MSFSLINKFRGAWLGNCLGEFEALNQSCGKSYCGAGRIAGLGAKILVNVGYLDLVHWQKQIGIIDPSLLNLAGSLQISEAIWAALPVTLFYHEQPQKLASAILSTLNFWLQAPDSAELGLGMAEAIAFLLGKDPYPQKIMAQTNLGKLLKLSPQFWLELPCLELAIKEITRHNSPSYVPIAIACYCFLCTPTDFSLSIRRAKLAPQPELVIPLVGILSGAYNGLRGIPWQWYAESLNLSHHFLAKSSIDPLSKPSQQVLIDNFQYQLIDQLFSVWAGHYQTDSSSTTSWQNQIVAVPKDIYRTHLGSIDDH